MMVGHAVNMVPREFIWTGGDCHLYNNHIELAKEYLNRPKYTLPTVEIKSNTDDIFSFKAEDFVLKDYECGPFMKAPIAV